MNENRKVLSYGDSLLYSSDVSLLEGGKWLNDKVIGFVFEYFEREKFNHISKDDCLISPEVAQYVKLARGQEEIRIFLEPLNLDKKKIIFFPINDNLDSEIAGGSHWSLLVYYQQENKFMHFDSLNGSNFKHAKQLKKKLSTLLKDAAVAEFIEVNCPQQTNCYDCGMYVLCYTDEIYKNIANEIYTPFDIQFDQDHIANERISIKQLIPSLAKGTT